MASNALRFLDLSDPSTPIPSMKVDLLNKEVGIHQYVHYMLDRTNSMFEWKGLPDTIPAYMLELYLQIFGYAAFVKVDEQRDIRSPYKLKFKPGVHIFWGGIGGERDIYYRPRMFIASNPRLEKSIQSTIIYKGDDLEGIESPCVLMRDDTNYMGLLPLFNRYAAQMVENDISIRSAQINARAQVGISTSNDREAESARKYLDNLEAGKLATIAEGNLLDGISVANVGTQSANVIIQLIELQQYLKASWFNDLGLNANFNMKREYISREEIGSQTDVLLPLVDDMLDCRREAAELLSEVFQLTVKVEKNSAWASKDQTILNSLSAGAVEGGIGLTGPVEDMATQDGMKEATDVQLAGNSATVAEGNSEGPGAGETDGAGVGENQVNQENASEDVHEEAPADVQVTVNVNVNTEEGGEESAESETQEKSEESDAE